MTKKDESILLYIKQVRRIMIISKLLLDDQQWLVMSGYNTSLKPYMMPLKNAGKNFKLQFDKLVNHLSSVTSRDTANELHADLFGDNVADFTETIDLLMRIKDLREFNIVLKKLIDEHDKNLKENGNPDKNT